MKGFKEVEATRRAYHADAARDSVHRSSLLVPELPGAAAEISFLNHFLIKRGYKKVACRISAIDPAGRRIESRLHTVDQARVYTIPLTGMVDEPVATYLVEFFAAENLFIPFPAVMVNHRGRDFINTVHAFNRVLNDPFEDDAINATANREASIDVVLERDTDTVALFMAGQQPCRGEVQFELVTAAGRERAEVAVDVARFGHRALSLRKAFPARRANGGVLTIRQPRQFMFYGRMLVLARRPDGAFSGNHSYYDSSATRDYWDDARPSVRLYPFLGEFANRLRMYPIMSPGRLAVALILFGRDGAELRRVEAGVLDSPGSNYVECSVDEAAARARVAREEIAAFAVSARPVAGNTPTRINHQLVYGDKAGASPLAASINVSLVNANVFQPAGKTGRAWGQAPIGGGARSVLGIVRNFPGGDSEAAQLRFWGEAGQIAERTVDLPGSGAVVLEVADALAGVVEGDVAAPAQNIWYEVHTPRSDISAFVATRHAASGHCTGEHSY